MTIGTPARAAASRPSTPAFPLWVWTMSGLVWRKMAVSFCSARKSSHGFTGRTSSGRMVSTPGWLANSASSEPSGPVVGPEIKFTCKSGSARNPRTEAMVFSWAPPTTSRVMTCVTRMASLGFLALEAAKTFGHGRVFGGVRGGGVEVIFRIPDGGIGVAPAQRDLGQTVVWLELRRVEAHERFIICLGFVEPAALEVCRRAI